MPTPAPVDAPSLEPPARGPLPIRSGFREHRLLPRRAGDVVAHVLTAASAVLLLAILAVMLMELWSSSLLSRQAFGWKFITTSDWNPVLGEFGALSSIYGTLITTAIAMVIAVPLSLVIALFLVELAPPWLGSIMGGAIELLAAVPSIVYGMWGLFVFAPYMSDYIQPWLGSTLGQLPLLGALFRGPKMGIGLLTAGLILALMILPFITAVTRDVFRMIPPITRESAYGMGSTTWEVTRRVTIPYALRGVVGASLLGLGRALGETMAVTFVIGNNHQLSASLFGAGNTISSTLANEFAEASEPLYLSALVELGLVLFALTFVVQAVAQLWIRRVSRSAGAGR